MEGIIVKNDLKDKLEIGLVKLVKDWLTVNKIHYSQIDCLEVNNDIVFQIDVGGDVILRDFHINDLHSIPEYIKFRDVSGSFVLGNRNS